MGKSTDIPAEEQIARLVAQVESLSRDNERLARDNAELARAAAEAARGPAGLAEELRAELAAVKAERDRLIELVRLSNQRFFGCKSEKVIPDQLSLFNDMEAAADGSPEPAFEDAVPAKPRKRGGKRKIDYSKLEQVVVRHELPAGSRGCPGCGAEMEEFNVEVTYSLRMVPAHLVAERNERAVYRCPGCCAADAAGGEAPAAIVRAPMPAPPIRGSFATPSLIAYVVNGKYSNSLPLYRMEQDFRCLGAGISRQNMANWVMRSWELWLSRLRARMKDLLLMGDIVHTLPFLAKPLVSAMFASFTLIITDYGVPIMVGGKCTTLSVLMYQEVIGRLNFDAGIAIGVVLLVPAIAAFVADLLASGEGRLGFSAHPKRIGDNLGRDVASHAFLAVLVLFLASPLAAFAVVAFVVKYPIDMAFTLANIDRAMVFGMASYLANSLVVAVAVSVVGSALSWLAAYVSTRTPGAFGRVLHLICITTMAIPGLVLGLSYMLLFKGSAIYGTIGILVLVNLVHFFASPYLMARNALGKLNSSLESVGQTLGVPRRRMIADVLLPQTRETIVEVAGYYFVNCMVTISAVAFLANVSHMPLALLISDFDTQMLVECAALVSIVIFVANVAAKAVLVFLKKVVLSRM